MNNLAMLLRAQGHLTEARKLLEEMLQYQRRVLDRDNPQAMTSMINLALMMEDQGQVDEAQKLLEETLDLQRRILTPEHPNTLKAMHSLARLLRDRGRFGEARPLFDQTIELERRVLPAGHPETLRTVSCLAWMFAAASDPQARDPRRAVDLAKELVHYAPNSGTYSAILGVAHYRAGEWAEAIAALEKSEALAPGKYTSPNAFVLAMAHWQRAEKEKARQWYDTGTGWMDKNQSKDAELLRFQAEAAQLLGLSGR
jgi:tetratricopeptide (TPR) repeat protein